MIWWQPLVLVVAILAVATALMTSAFWAPALWWRVRPRIAPTPDDCMAEAIADLLLDDPRGWQRVSANRIRHRDGLTIWTGNEAYGLHVEGKDGREYKPNGSARSTIWRAYRASRLNDADRLLIEANTALRRLDQDWPSP